MFMQVAKEISRLGTCDRKQVGAVIVLDGRCVTWGFNGAPPGLPHCEDNGHGWLDILWAGKYEAPNIHDEWIQRKLEENGCRNATHAEANALAFAARQGISTDGSELFVTVSPCENCARLIIAAGITRVYYLEVYRKDDGISLLQKASIQSLQLS